MHLILETNRLLGREMLRSATEVLFKMVRNEKVHQYLWNKPIIAISALHYSKGKNTTLNSNIGLFVVILKDNKGLIGWAGLKYDAEMFNNKVDFYDIRYRLKEKFWGKGYGSEASFGWLNYGFDIMKIKVKETAAQTNKLALNRIVQKIGLTMIKNI